MVEFEAVVEAEADAGVVVVVVVVFAVAEVDKTHILDLAGFLEEGVRRHHQQ